MTLEFLTLAVVIGVLGVVFTAFPRQIAEGVRGLFGRTLSEGRAPGPVRAVGVILLCVAGLLVVFALLGNYPRA